MGYFKKILSFEMEYRLKRNIQGTPIQVHVNLEIQEIAAFYQKIHYMQTYVNIMLIHKKNRDFYQRQKRLNYPNPRLRRIVLPKIITDNIRDAQKTKQG